MGLDFVIEVELLRLTLASSYMWSHSLSYFRRNNSKQIEKLFIGIARRQFAFIQILTQKCYNPPIVFMNALLSKNTEKSEK